MRRGAIIAMGFAMPIVLSAARPAPALDARTSRLAEIVSRTARTPAVAPPSPRRTELQRLADTFAATLGAPALPGRDQLSRLPGDLAAQLTPVLGALLECAQASRVAGAELAAAGRLSAESVAAIDRCAVRLDARAAGLQAFLATSRSSTLPSVDVWPVLRIEGTGRSTTYASDYALLIDTGGNDRYFNNAGGNLIDVLRPPSAGPARGCQNIPDLAEGNCVIGAALLIDMGGNDTYGRLETPDEDAVFVSPIDGSIHRCTSDEVVRRIVTEGAGIAGVGMLLDDGGNDHYIGKTLSQGAGHVGGVGVLRDTGAGKDSYLAIRSSQGFGLVDGFGLLRDDGGNDSYRSYLPAGGVVSDKGVCDDVQRNTQGAGLLGGEGVLIDEGGRDTYRASAAAQGYGGLGGFGVLWDWGGRDDYGDYPGHEDSVRAGPSAESTGLFIDDS